MSEMGDQAWFAEGIAEELLIALSQVEQLSVMARTSSFAFKDTDKTIAEIAGILGVQAVLEGSVRRSGDRVRITAQLVDATSGYHLWSGSYERELTDIFQLQDELARAIVQALQVELGVEAVEPLVAEQTKSLEAYNWFMRGRALFSWANPESTDQTINYFEKAVEVDPDYALAWGYLAFAHMTSMAWKSFAEAGPATISAYKRALALDPDQSEALASKALMTQLLERDWETAGNLYRQAMASTDNSNAIVAYSIFYLLPIGRSAEAIRLNADAEKRDPLNVGYKTNLAEILRLSGDAEAAARKAREALQLNPSNMLAIIYLVHLYTDTEDFAALQRLLDSIPTALQERPEIRALIGRYYAARGYEEKARQIYRELTATFHSLTPVGKLVTAELALSLNEVEESINLQERLAKGGSWLQFWIKPLFRNNEAMREHPRYQALLKRMGLDDESVAALHRKMSFE
jgi:TolB-like protein/cytochrome c-type biogenesis protein CcmH/NrfG